MGILDILGGGPLKFATGFLGDTLEHIFAVPNTNPRVVDRGRVHYAEGGMVGDPKIVQAILKKNPKLNPGVASKLADRFQAQEEYHSSSGDKTPFSAWDALEYLSGVTENFTHNTDLWTNFQTNAKGEIVDLSDDGTPSLVTRGNTVFDYNSGNVADRIPTTQTLATQFYGKQEMPRDVTMTPPIPEGEEPFVPLFGSKTVKETGKKIPEVEEAVAKGLKKLGEYEVKPGDTLWGVARELSPKKDSKTIKDLVEQIQALNNLPGTSIKAGQVLNLPEHMKSFGIEKLSAPKTFSESIDWSIKDEKFKGGENVKRKTLDETIKHFDTTKNKYGKRFGLKDVKKGLEVKPGMSTSDKPVGEDASKGIPPYGNMLVFPEDRIREYVKAGLDEHKDEFKKQQKPIWTVDQILSGLKKVHEKTGYVPPVDLLFAQMHKEGAFHPEKWGKEAGRKQARSPYTNPVNVGENDSRTTLKFDSPEAGIYAWGRLLWSDYLSNRNVDDIIKDYRNWAGKRYARDGSYERAMRKFIPKYRKLFKDKVKSKKEGEAAPRFQEGGKVDQIPIEIEGGEAIETPNGEVTQIQGPTHEQGGIGINVPEESVVWTEELLPLKKAIEKAKEKSDAIVKRAEDRVEKTEKFTDNHDYQTDVVARSTEEKTKQDLEKAQERHMALVEELERIEQTVENYMTMKNDMNNYRQGGKVDKNEWVSKKISILRDEGYPQKQAVAIALSMWNKNHEQGGYVDNYPHGGKVHKKIYQGGGEIEKLPLKQPGYVGTLEEQARWDELTGQPVLEMLPPADFTPQLESGLTFTDVDAPPKAEPRSLGDMGDAGTLLSGISPIAGALSAFALSNENINPYAEYGKEAESTLDEAFGSLGQSRDLAQRRAGLAANTARRAARNRARGVNTLNTLEQGVLGQELSSIEDITNAYSQGLSNLYSRKASLQSEHQAKRMAGQEQKLIRDQQDRMRKAELIGEIFGGTGTLLGQMQKRKNTKKVLAEKEAADALMEVKGLLEGLFGGKK